MLEDQDLIPIQEVRHKEIAAGADGIDRQTVMAIVEQYLRERGLIPEPPRVQAVRPAAGHG